uniref:DUF4629 domain-containing protein n=1 Tax=Equus asinus TaxID=9793 RepID=A0A9L0J0R3_EQUAS
MLLLRHCQKNFQNPSLLGTPNSLQLSLPVVSDAASLAGSVCNFSRVSAPAVSSGWLLPSATGTSSQPLMGSAYLYQHSSTTTLSGVTGQSQSSTSAAASYPGLFEWGVPGSTAQESSSLGDCTLTVTGHDTTVSSMSMAAHYDRTSGANNPVPLYPSLSTSLVQGTPSQVPNQGHSLSLPYQEGSQVYYYGHGTLGPLLSGELGPCLQSYGSVSYTGAGASAPQPEMVLVLKEIQPTHVLPPASTSGVYYAASAPAIPQTRSQGEYKQQEETFLGLQPPSQTFCLQQTPEFPKSCSSRNTQMLQSNPPHEPADISLTASLQTSNSNLLALSPAPKNWDEFNTNLSKPLDPDQIPIENQDPLPHPLEIPDILQLLACIDPLGPEDHPASENADLGKSSLSLEGQGTLENGTEASGGFADIATLMEDGHLPQLFDPLKDLDQPQAAERKDASDNTRKNKHQASEPLDGAPKAKIQPKDPECLSGGEGLICNAAASDRAPENEAEHSNSKPQKAAPSRISTTKSHGQERTKKTRGNNPKKAGESRQSGTEVRVEEKPMMPRMKRRKNQPELSQETFKRPRTSLGQHMLESVQVFHALGRKSEKNTGPSSSRALGTCSNPKHPQPCPAIKPWLDKPLEGQCPEETQVKAQKAESSAEMDLLCLEMLLTVFFSVMGVGGNPILQEKKKVKLDRRMREKGDELTKEAIIGCRAGEAKRGEI